MTLTDLLAAIAVLGLVLAAGLTVLDQGHRVYRHGVARVEAQQAARIALERMAREIRQAGTGLAPAALSVVERARLVLHVDLDGDGAVSGRRETITWLLSGSVLRRNAGGGAQPIVEGVRDLEIAYFDTGGRPTHVPDEVRAVTIALTTDGGPRGAGSTTLRTTVRLRNR
ncbi:MAG: PilW family protein [Candidatus Rokuibacteriota bacterium]